MIRDSPSGIIYTYIYICIYVCIHVASHRLEDFPFMSTLPIHAKPSHAWEDVLCWRGLSIHGRFSHVSEMPMYGKTFHVCENLPNMGRPPTCWKTSHVWEDPPYAGLFFISQLCLKSFFILYNSFQDCCCFRNIKTQTLFQMLHKRCRTNFFKVQTIQCLGHRVILASHYCGMCGTTFHTWEV